MTEKTSTLDKKTYETELLRLQSELVAMQEWVKATGARIVIIFEGRDAAGKGGAISRVTEFLNPRVAQVAALPAPTERQQTQWFFQRYIEHLPAGGEIRLFDRSWYNRAGVERVMGYCTEEQYKLFMQQCPTFEQMLIDDGILLRKYWFEVDDKEQHRRFKSRLDDPMRRWKLSPNDLAAIDKAGEYQDARDVMFKHTDTDISPWYVVDSNNKKKARINMIHHLLSTIPYQEIDEPKLKLPRAPKNDSYRPPTMPELEFVPDFAATLAEK